MLPTCSFHLACKAQYATAVLSGKGLAQDIYRSLKTRIKALDTQYAITPTLSIVQIGKGHEDSQVYIEMKMRAAAEIGVKCEHISLDETASQSELLESIRSLSQDERTHGILLQLPIPSRLEPHILLDAIAPWKDVDGFHSYNIGQLCRKTGEPYFVPCTAKAILALLRSHRAELAGLHAVILGRSNVVGLPISQLLLRENATITICHSKTRDLEQRVRSADILVVAVGQPLSIPGDWIPKGCIVVDVGIHRARKLEGRAGRIVGDVQAEQVMALGVARALTPVPGGVGPMTVASLMENVVLAAERGARHYGARAAHHPSPAPDFVKTAK